jgi:hypothetical protein
LIVRAFGVRAERSAAKVALDREACKKKSGVCRRDNVAEARADRRAGKARAQDGAGAG